MSRVAHVLSPAVVRPLLSARKAFFGAWYSGTSRWCPVCNRSSRRFRTYGLVPREEAECPQCGALERHRLVWLYFTGRTDLFDGREKRVLHVAPEPCLEDRFRRRLGEGYLTGDLLDPHAMERMDITDIRHPDESFDVVYCSHVLEHVPDDRRAMRELHRVLKKDGWAVLLVPITVERTVEDPTITDPAERERLFGQHDHVRRYGSDYVDRLREAGFEVSVTEVSDLLGEDERRWMGLSRSAARIYGCRRSPDR
ncbi:MAG TPA: methyltransferase domain-containing protein [Gemmatimonadales bacterium]|jgi:SAM-dependent methyltransferase